MTQTTETLRLSDAHERLSKQLMECAMLVKKGEKSPLLSQTIHDLTDYLTSTAAVSSPTDANSSSSSSPTAGHPEQKIKQKEPATVSKPIKPPHAFAVLGKIVGLSGADVTHEPAKTEADKKATSEKNAARVKAELEQQQHEQHKHTSWLTGHHEEQEWCEEHFTMGCGCKTRKTEAAPPAQQQQPAARTTTPRSTAVSSNASAASTTTTSIAAAAERSAKPAFQRPTNPKSTLIANGWIEQQRRSKLRTAWKDVLASLVEGRKAGEETTLWIQREVVNQSTGKTDLEALHQIPVKWLEDINYHEYSTDNRFSLKIYNLADEFIFRCPDDEDAAQNWVLTLRSAQEIALKKQSSVAAAAGNGATAAANKSMVGSAVEEEKKADERKQPPAAHAVVETPSSSHRMSVQELRAIAHGAGINTQGMERGELEDAVAKIALAANGGAQQKAAPDAEALRREQLEEQERRRKLEELRRRQQMEEEAARRRAAEEAARRAAAEEEQKRKVEHQRRMAELVKERQAAERRKREEAERHRLAEERKKRDEEQLRRREAERRAAEEQRRQEEAQRLQQQQWQQQQQAWQKQQAEEQRRQQEAQRRAAEERRRQEEAYRRQQQQQQQQQQWQHAQQHVPHPQQHQQQSWPHGATPQPQPGYGQAPPSRSFPGQQQPPPPTSSPINAKYAEMAHQTEDDSQLAIHHVKHGLLVQWALLPPMLQVLRPIEQLITTIQTVFPPRFGIPGHAYFSKWKILTVEQVSLGPAMGNRPDDKKLARAVRKLRFFLHSDRWPRDFNREQEFLCKMLWDITNDAWEEHRKKEEDLGWIRGAG